MSIASGEHVTLGGFTGSGKTSMVLALLNHLEYRGSIKIDDVEVYKISRQELCSRFTILPQRSVFLPGTVEQNLMPWRFANGSNFDDLHPIIVVDVLLRTELWGLIYSVGGLQTPMHSIDLTDSQHRQFALARAMLQSRYSGHQLVIMDEPFSAIEPSMRGAIEQAITEFFRHTSTTVLSTCSLSDQSTPIWYVSKGRLRPYISSDDTLRRIE